MHFIHIIAIYIFSLPLLQYPHSVESVAKNLFIINLKNWHLMTDNDTREQSDGALERGSRMWAHCHENFIRKMMIRSRCGNFIRSHEVCATLWLSKWCNHPSIGSWMFSQNAEIRVEKRAKIGDIIESCVVKSSEFHSGKSGCWLRANLKKVFFHHLQWSKSLWCFITSTSSLLLRYFSRYLHHFPHCFSAAHSIRASRTKASILYHSLMHTLLLLETQHFHHCYLHSQEPSPSSWPSQELKQHDSELWSLFIIEWN